MSRTLKEIAEEIAGWFITGLVALAFLGFIYWVAFVYNVQRYKIESTIFDSKYEDAMGLLEIK